MKGGCGEKRTQRLKSEVRVLEKIIQIQNYFI